METDVPNLYDEPASGLTAKQIETVSEATGMVNVWEGAVSSGKTVASLYRWLMFIASTRDLPGEVVLTGRTRDSAWRNALLPMMDLYPCTVVGNLGAPSARLLGQRVHVIGASDAKAESVLRGITCKAIYIDELTTIPEAFFKMALSRLRVTGRKGGVASKLFAATNPDNPMHWLRKDYLMRLPHDEELRRTWKSFHFTLEDNPRLSPDYIRSMKAQYTGLFYKRFILGEWVQGEGMIWDQWSEERHVVDLVDVPKIERLIGVGVDYGNNHKSAGVLLGMAQGTLYVLAEWAPMRDDHGTLSPSRQSASLRLWLQRQALLWGPIEAVYVDPAALAFREQLQVDGLATFPAWKSVKPGLEMIHSLFSIDRLKVLNTCTQLREEIPGYVWDQKAADKGKDEPVKENDDFCDALRYAVHSSQPQWMGAIPMLYPTAATEV